MADIARVKRNIQRMIDQGAPESDIDAYVASEGTSPEELRSAGQAARADISAALPSVNLARAKADAAPEWAKPLIAADDLATLAASGMSFGFADKAAAGIDSLMGRGSYDERLKYRRGKTQEARDRAGIPGMISEVGTSLAPVSAAVKAGATATRLPGIIGKGLGLTADSAAIGALTAAGNDQDITEGALIGGALGMGGQVAGNLVGKVITPFRSTAERAKMANVLKREGVDITAGQKVGSKKLRYAESELGQGAAEDFAEKQGEQFTAAALKRVGEKADRATPEVVDRAFGRIGQGFDNLSRRNAIIPDQQAAADLTQIAVDYGSLVAPSARLSKIEKSINDIISLMQTGRVDGKVYKTFRSDLSRYAREVSQPEARTAANEIVNALDDVMERSIARTNPRDLGEWKKVRRQYRNMLVIERSATAAGDNARLGIISPSSLRSATIAKQGRRNFARGTGDFAELARAGEAVMKELPQSGTAPRLAARGIPNMLGAAVGAGAGYNDNGLQGAALGLVGGAAVPYAMGRAMLSGPGRAYLSNQAMANMPPELRNMIIRALAAGGTGALQK